MTHSDERALRFVKEKMTKRVNIGLFCLLDVLASFSEQLAHKWFLVAFSGVRGGGLS